MAQSLFITLLGCMASSALGGCGFYLMARPLSQKRHKVELFAGVLATPLCVATFWPAHIPHVSQAMALSDLVAFVFAFLPAFCAGVAAGGGAHVGRLVFK